MKTAIIPDDTAPNRPPDGEVNGYWFWLGGDAEEEDDMGDDDTGVQGVFRFGDGGTRMSTDHV